MVDDAPVTRAEYEALLRRLDRIEALLFPRPAPPATPPAPATAAPGAPPSPTPLVQARTPLPVPTPLPAAPRPQAPVPVPAPSSRPAARGAQGFETLLGERFAPRVGAVLVFLASLFFLGVAIQRGWIGPLAQLGIAAAFSFALLVVAAWLSRKRGYGTYPQVLEGTAICILYATAFVAYAVPYYNDATRLTEIGGGILMALVAAGAVGLALARDSRVIVGLGYALSFATAGLGFADLPGLTLAYVAILGATLAFVVARRAWFVEGAMGSALTGVFFFLFALDARDGTPAPAMVVAASLVPLVALLWLSLRARTPGDEGFGASVAVLTLAWGAAAMALPFEDVRVGGLIVLGWALVAAALAAFGAAGGTARFVVLAHGTSAVVLFLVGVPLVADGATNEALAVTLTYAAAALALALAQRAIPRAARGLWLAGLGVAAVAAARAIFVDAPFAETRDGAFGSWEAWATFLVLFPALALLTLLAPRDEPSLLARLAFVIGVVFVGAWGFALFATPFLVTMYLLAAGALLVAGAARGRALSADAAVGGFGLVALAAMKAATYDAYTSQEELPGWLAALEALLVAGTLLALHHMRPRQGRLPESAGAAALVGGSAAVLAAFLVAYGEGAWTSLLLGTLGVAYLATGFALKRDAMYRYVGFATLGFVLLRVFAVDLRETDLVVRAAVFAALGLALLAIGYVYARSGRKRAPPPP